MSKRQLDRALCVEDFRDLARRKVPKVVFDYIEGGADDEVTVKENRSAFARWQLIPRVLVDVGSRSMRTRLFEQTLEMPVLLAPTGMAGFASPAGEVGAVRAAEAMGTRLVVSTASAYSIEEVARAAHERHWFQLYPWGDRDLMKHLVSRASAGGFEVLCVTVDVPVSGNRERDRRNGFTTRPQLSFGAAFDFASHPGWWARYLRNRRFEMSNLASAGTRGALGTIRRFSDLLNPQMTWHDLMWLRSLWEGPFVVKGLTHPDDARRAVDSGADGIVVSNHGGRQLDGVTATLDMLPQIVEAVGSEVPVLIDGGVRRGTDVVKALCLGATACLIGRPYLYGLAAGGQRGVERLLDCLRTEIDRTLALLGCAHTNELRTAAIRRPPGAR